MSQSNTNIRHTTADRQHAPYLARISIFPLKSLPECSLDEVNVLPGGGLTGDRLLAMFDSDGGVVNAKRTAKIHTIRAEFNLARRMISISSDQSQSPARYLLDEHRTKLEEWLSGHFALNIQLREDAELGYPDDPDLPGPTVISTASLREVSAWFDIDLDEARRRFRANLEIDGVPAFWEDGLVGEAGQAVNFQIGDIVLAGLNPCQRCVVPSRDSLTGAVTPSFAKHFSQRREQTLPDWANRSRFDHFYRLSVNTRLVSGAGKTLRVRDAVTLLDS